LALAGSAHASDKQLLRHEQRNGEATKKMWQAQSIMLWWKRREHEGRGYIVLGSFIAADGNECCYSLLRWHSRLLPLLHKCLPLVLLPRQRTCLQH
jgi:hypothetical protein